MTRSGTARQARTYEIDIILHQISLEGLSRQSPITHGHNKRVVDVAVPYWGDVGSFEKIIEEVTADEALAARFGYIALGRQSSRREWKCLDGVKVVEGPVPLAQSRRRPDGGIDVSDSGLDSRNHVHPLGEVRGNGGCG